MAVVMAHPLRLLRRHISSYPSNVLEGALIGPVTSFRVAWRHDHAELLRWVALNRPWTTLIVDFPAVAGRWAHTDCLPAADMIVVRKIVSDGHLAALMTMVLRHGAYFLATVTINTPLHNVKHLLSGSLAAHKARHCHVVRARGLDPRQRYLVLFMMSQQVVGLTWLLGRCQGFRDGSLLI